MTNEISGALKDRLNSNILGTFTLFYLTLNWRFFVYVFSNMEAKEKIDAAKNIYWEGFGCNLILAIVFTGFVLFALPFARVWYDMFSFKRLGESELIKKINENKVSLNLAEVDRKLNQVIATNNTINEIQTLIRTFSTNMTNMESNAINNRNWPQAQLQIASLKSEFSHIAEMVQGVSNNYSDFKSTYEKYVKIQNDKKQKQLK